MPTILGIPLIGFIQIIVGAAVIIFVLINYLNRPKKNKANESIIQHVHVIERDI